MTDTGNGNVGHHPSHKLNALTPALVKRHSIEQGWHFGLEFRARWSDLDGYSHVSHRTHFVWYEEVRNLYFAEAGHPLVDADVPGPVIVEVGGTYQRPLEFGDEVVVTGRTVWMGRTSLRMDYAVWRHGLVARAHAVCVWMRNSDQERIQLPNGLREYLVKIDRTVDR